MASTSGNSAFKSSAYLWARHPHTITCLTAPSFFSEIAHSISSMDSSFALSINAQVFTIRISASEASDTIICPPDDSLASIFSLSTLFLSQPSEIAPILIKPYLRLREEIYSFSSSVSPSVSILSCSRVTFTIFLFLPVPSSVMKPYSAIWSCIFAAFGYPKPSLRCI